MFNLLFRHTRDHPEAYIVALTVLFCTAVATILTFINGNVWLNYNASYAIGVTCMSVQLWAHKHRPASWNREFVTVVAGIVSLLLGLLLGGAIGAFDPWYFFRTSAIGITIGGVACVVAGFLILLMGYIRDLEADRETAQQQALVRERELATAQLRTLQAQIEPHFLFNTLANVQALIESNPSKAKDLLASLTELFRASIEYSRATVGTLHQECELMSHYLEIHRVRLGDRFTYSIEIEDGLDDIELPPFLIQPLVENAIRHGIEPSSAPGQITVKATRDRSELKVLVANSHDPVACASKSTGIGIQNVEERLRSVYGDSAHLTIQPQVDGRFQATIVLPYEEVVA